MHKKERFVLCIIIGERNIFLLEKRANKNEKNKSLLVMGLEITCNTFFYFGSALLLLSASIWSVDT